jgi:hypothetical protein
LVVERGVFDFETVAGKGVVLWLFDDRGNEVVALGDEGCFSDLGGAPFGCSPVIG